jgi:hypothetical protein
MGNIIRPIIAAVLLSVGYGFAKNGGWGNWIVGGLCFALSGLLFWAIFTGKFKEKKEEGSK